MQKDELAEVLESIIRAKFSNSQMVPSIAREMSAAVRAYANRENVVAVVAKAIHEDHCRQDLEGYLAMEVDCHDTATAAISAMLGGGDAE